MVENPITFFGFDILYADSKVWIDIDCFLVCALWRAHDGMGTWGLDLRWINLSCIRVTCDASLEGCYAAMEGLKPVYHPAYIVRKMLLRTYHVAQHCVTAAFGDGQ